MVMYLLVKMVGWLVLWFLQVLWSLMIDLLVMMVGLLECLMSLLVKMLGWMGCWCLSKYLESYQIETWWLGC